ncbi:hypothetical protein IFM89_011893 [Coptis chinensis]|uniref:Separase-like second TPR repeats region domain-containing protein n=1 Tax=Coptis chinensis TaxID=261450 RepID=A0A835HXN8_9MAGN|nr:hypothetical protein IFM89_011893 [Coptis chinensis]
MEDAYARSVTEVLDFFRVDPTRGLDDSQIARNICYTLSSQWSSKYLLIVDMLKCLMDFIRNDCEFRLTNSPLQLSTGSADLLYLADVLHRLETYLHKCSRSCKSEQARSSFPSYLNALAFVCHPLAEIVNKASQLILAEEKFNPLSTKLMFILDAFQQFCDVFFICYSCASEKEREKFRESRNTLVLPIKKKHIAAFTISLRTDKKLEVVLILLIEMLLEDVPSLESTSPRSEDCSLLSDVKSLAWGHYGDANDRHKDASFREFLFVYGDRGIPVHVFCHMDGTHKRN